jgi:hypothetical protein
LSIASGGEHKLTNRSISLRSKKSKKGMSKSAFEEDFISIELQEENYS